MKKALDAQSAHARWELHSGVWVSRLSPDESAALQLGLGTKHH